LRISYISYDIEFLRIRFNKSLLEYTIFIRIHIRFNHSLFEYAIFNRNYSKRDFYSKYHNVKQNVAKSARHIKKTIKKDPNTIRH